MPVPETGAGSGARPAGAASLLRGNPGFRALWCARVVSVAGDALSLVALMLHVAETTGQAIAVSLLLLAGDFAPSLLGPVTGAIGDRFDLRRVMIAGEAAQGAVLLLIALWLPPLPLLLPLVGLRAILGQVFLPASRAALPALVRDRDLEAANSVLGFGTNAAEALGPLLAAALLPVAGVRGVLLADAVSFLLAGALLLRLRPLPPARGDGAATSLFQDARAGLGYIRSAKAVRVVAAGFCAVVACNGVDDVALVLLATETFAAGDAAAGVLLAAAGIGLLLGYALLTRFGARARLAALLVAGFAVSSLGNLLTGLAWAVAAAFTAQLVRGLGIAAMDVAAHTLLQRLVPAALLGRVFGNLYGAVGVAAAFSYLAGGLLLDATSAPATLVIAGTGGTLVAVLVALALPRALRGHAPPDAGGAQPRPPAE